MGDQPEARPLPTQEQHNTEKTRTHIHTPSRIRTCNPKVRVAKDSMCLRPRGHWDQQKKLYYIAKIYVRILIENIITSQKGVIYFLELNCV